MTGSPKTQTGEFGRGWPVVAGAGIGLMFSVAALLLYPFGVFMGPLGAEFGWSRTELSGAITVLQLSTAISAPLYGWLIDRFTARPIALVSLAVLGVLVMSLSALKASYWHLYIVFALIPLLAGGATPIPYARLVVERFDRSRGLALGLALSGVGLGAAILPPFAQYLIAHGGWRNAYLAFGAATLILALPSCALLLRPAPPGGQSQPSRQARQPYLQLIWTRAFLTLAVLFALVGGVTVGVVAHFAPILIERGLSPSGAASALSIVGLAVILGRIGIGLALDRIHAVSVLGVVLGGFTASLGLLLWSDGGLAYYLAAFLIGLAVGAEVDVMAYLISRYFPMTVFGSLYGAIFAVFVVGSGAGPLLIGWLFEQHQSYRSGLGVLIAVLILALVICTRLPRYVKSA